MVHFRSAPALAGTRPPLAEGDAAWVRAGRLPFDEFSVGSLVPAVFERYVRVLNPACGPHGERVTWAAVAAWSGRVAHALAQWELIAVPRDGVAGPPPFAEPPVNGPLARDDFGRLCGLLAAATTTPDRCFAGVWAGYGGVSMLGSDEWPELALDERSFLVTTAGVDGGGLIGWPGPAWDAALAVPTLLWPADRAWFVAADTDLDSTYVGCGEALAAELLGAAGLETWPAESGDDVSVGADEVNA